MPHHPGKPDPRRIGLIAAVAAYLWWGLIPLYFKALAHVPPVVVLCHRIVWSVAFLVILVTIKRQWPALLAIRKNRRALVLLACASILIAANWLVFIYAVGHNHLLQASLGYFINPLLSVLLALIVLREKLRPWQWVAVGIATIGVANLALRGSEFPWIALTVAGSFALYGLVRKFITIGAVESLTAETMILLPLAAGYLLIYSGQSNSLSTGTYATLSLAGIITVLPLLWFAAATRRLKLSTIGFLQYFTPTGQFLVAVLLFKEPLLREKLISFVFCWTALLVYSVDSIIAHHAQRVVEMAD